MSNSSNDTHYLDEWKAAREVLASYDERLDSLRKYGFSFLTALLTADSILLPASIPTIADKALPDEVKLAVLIVNLFLIVALQFIDRNYQVFQEAAASRASVLERALNLELTDVISQRYGFGHVRRYVACVYFAFVAGVGILGSAIFYVDRAKVSVLVENVFGIAIFISVIFIVYQLTFSLDFPYGQIDWTVYPLQCVVGEKVAITVTNLNKKERIRFVRGEVLWEIKNEDSRIRGLEKVKLTKEESAGLQVSPNDSYTWLWDTSGAKAGIYRVYRAVVKPHYIKKLFRSDARTFIDSIKKHPFKKTSYKKAPQPIEIHKHQIQLQPLSRKITIVEAPSHPARKNRR